ncbi:hypothetical protein [Nocardioides sp. HB32]
MSTPALAAYDRAVNRGTAVSAVGHALIIALGVFAANDIGRDDPGSTMFWLLALFAALSLVATMLAWASVRAGKIVWDLGVLSLVGGVGVLVWATTVRGGLMVVVLGGVLLFMDWLVFRNALKLLTTP